MARIVIIRHGEERPGDFYRFMMHGVGELWTEAGHEVLTHHGCENLPDADLAVLHVNRSIVPQEYLDAAARYPRCINRAVADISKRAVSRHLVAPDDDWEGPVIVKTDLNYSGLPEWRSARQAFLRGEGKDPGPRAAPYLMFAAKKEVPARIWDKRSLIVERFLPEYDGEHYYLRVWLFLGDSGSARRSVSLKRIVKGDNVIRVDREPLVVPESILGERERLGFDYGKFDYVVHEGETILLDANKTPGYRRGGPRGFLTTLANGLSSMLGQAAAQ